MKEQRYQDVVMLRQEVSELEHQNVKAIENLETELSGLVEVLSVVEEDWSPRHDAFEIITMEEIPPLKESVRQLTAD